MLLKPALQVYVVAPEAVNVAVAFEHIVCGVTVNVGKALTVTVVTLCFVHPLASVCLVLKKVYTFGLESCYKFTHFINPK
jgi:hypothetical protein